MIAMSKAVYVHSIAPLASPLATMRTKTCSFIRSPRGPAGECYREASHSKRFRFALVLCTHDGVKSMNSITLLTLWFGADIQNPQKMSSFPASSRRSDTRSR